MASSGRSTEIRRSARVSSSPALPSAIRAAALAELGNAARSALPSRAPLAYAADWSSAVTRWAAVSETVHVYAPLGPDLVAHLGRVAAFNQRAERPTRWKLEAHTGPDYMERMLAERPGNVVVISSAWPFHAARARRFCAVWLIRMEYCDSDPSSL